MEIFMKSLIKKILFLMLGKERTLNTVNLIIDSLLFVKGRKYSFAEDAIIYRFLKSSKDSAVFVDVGAHHGESFEPYLKLGWKVVAFEPDSKNRNYIEVEIGLSESQKKNLQLLPYAISNESKDAVSFFASSQVSTISSLSAFHPTHQVSEVVDMRTLTQVLDNNILKDVRYLKIDAEGHDLFVLQGFPWVGCKPEIIMCEFEDNKTKPLGYDYTDLGRYLVEQGYIVYLSEWEPVVQYGVRHKWECMKRFPCELRRQNAWGNFIAVSTDAAQQYFDKKCSK
jgi:FkbM family methyltransferase